MAGTAASWHPTSVLVGRRRDVDDVERRLDQGPVTIVGAGGVGKTRVAAEVARRAADGGGTDVVWVDLASTADALGACWSALAQPPAPGLDALAGAVAERGACLVVLDNAEHVAGVVGALVESLAVRCPAARVLVTSRIPVAGARSGTHRLRPLGTPADDTAASGQPASAPSVALFHATAREVVPDFAVRGREAEAVAGLCRLFDGNALAIRLAAGRVAGLAPSALLASLQRSQTVLRSRTALGPVRQRSVDASIAWSVDLLDDAGRALLVAAAVFEGPFDAGAAVAVASGVAADPVDVLGALAEASLVDTDRQPDGGLRYRLHPLVRRFARRMAGDDGWDDLRRRHAIVVLDRAVVATTWGSSYSSAVGASVADLRVALAWAMAHDQALACRALASCVLALSTFDDVGPYAEWLAGDVARTEDWACAVARLGVAHWGAGVRLAPLLPAVLERATVDDDQHTLRLLRLPAAAAALAQGDLGPASALLTEADAAGDGLVAMIAGLVLSLPTAWTGDEEQARRVRAPTVRACRAGGVDLTATVLLPADAWEAHLHGRARLAGRCIERATGVGTVAETRRVVAMRIAHDRGDAAALARAATLVPSTGYYAAFAEATGRWTAASTGGDWDAAAAAAAEAVGAAPERWLEADAAAAWAGACLWSGVPADEALAHLRRTSGVAAGAPWPTALVELLLGRQALVSGDGRTADRHLGAALGLAAQHRLRSVLVDAVELTAVRWAASGRHRPAARLAAAAAAERVQRRWGTRLWAGPAAAATPDVVEPALAFGDAVAVACRPPADRARAGLGAPLTATERLVAELVAQGRTNAEVAATLGLRVPTVKSHLTRAFAKLGVTNRAQLVHHLPDVS